MPGAFRVGLPRWLPPTPTTDLPPERPPKPRKKENAEQQVICTCMLQSQRQTPELEKSNSLKRKDSGYDSTESSDNISLDSDSALDSERYSVRKTSCKIG